MIRGTRRAVPTEKNPDAMCKSSAGWQFEVICLREVVSELVA